MLYTNKILYVFLDPLKAKRSDNHWTATYKQRRITRKYGKIYPGIFWALGRQIF